MKKNAFFSYILHRLIIIINSFPNPYDFNVFFLESEPSLICKSDLDFHLTGPKCNPKLGLHVIYIHKLMQADCQTIKQSVSNITTGQGSVTMLFEESLVWGFHLMKEAPIIVLHQLPVIEQQTRE